MFKSIFLGCVFLVGSVALAAGFESAPLPQIPPGSGVQRPEVDVLKCQVTLAANDLGPNEGEAQFDAPVQSGKAHGGDPFEFKFKNHTVSVLADGKWLGVSWFRNSQLLAEGVTVIGSPTDEPRVLMLYNPADQNESAAVDCHK